MRRPIVDQPPLPMSQSQRGRGQARVLQSIRIDPPGMAADDDADDEVAVAGEANAIESWNIGPFIKSYRFSHFAHPSHND